MGESSKGTREERVEASAAGIETIKCIAVAGKMKAVHAEQSTRKDGNDDYDTKQTR